LLSQLEAVRGALDFLQRENARLRSADLLKTLPTLPRRQYTPALPALEPASPAGGSDDDDDERGPPTPGRRREGDVHRLESEATVLFRELSSFSASPQVVDLTAFGPSSASATATGKPRWMPRAKRPEAVLEARRKEAERLEGRVEDLKERAAQARAAQARLRYGF
jgi:hypothetical protein